MPDCPVFEEMRRVGAMMAGDHPLARCLKMCMVGRLVGEDPAAAAGLARRHKMTAARVRLAGRMVAAGVRQWCLRCPEVPWQQWEALAPLLEHYPDAVGAALFLAEIAGKWADDPTTAAYMANMAASEVAARRAAAAK